MLLVGTKLLDVITTLRRINHPGAETNPIARGMMLQFGTTNTVWVIFVIAVTIIGIAGLTAVRSGVFTQIVFVMTGITISIIQSAVAHCNWYGVDNFITKQIRRINIWIQRLLIRFKKP
jgi:hypothetical protein